MPSPLRAWRLALLVAGAVIVADQVTKRLVTDALERGEHVTVFFGIELTYVRNKGVAFGALGGGGTLVTVVTVAAVALLALYFAFHTERPWLWLPFGVVAGGAIGNLVDRLREGSVVDWIDPILWPAFNLADVAIVLGILGLLYVLEGPPKGRTPDD
ncbi:MAG TPA: signal peptidase II [Thermoleophilaceae bacterium]|nr:signal peptidase II [Thermoleophilaceae bacterium]